MIPRAPLPLSGLSSDMMTTSGGKILAGMILPIIPLAIKSMLPDVRKIAIATSMTTR